MEETREHLGKEKKRKKNEEETFRIQQQGV